MLVYAITLSMVLHFGLLYIPVLQSLFQILPLDMNEWRAVLTISAPVLVIDEILKFFERRMILSEKVDVAKLKRTKTV